MSGIDKTINEAFRPIASAMVDLVFFSVPVGQAQLPLIVLWLIAGALFFTVYLRLINIRGFVHAIRIVMGKEDQDPKAPGEVSHFQALTTAVSGTVGVGNITHVAVAISIGGRGATFWLIVAGFLGMASKFVECTLGVKYRQLNADGSVSGGPMFYLDHGLSRLNLPRLGKTLAWYYAVCIIVGSLGIGCMFQANQAYVQFVNVTGGDVSLFRNRGWLFGSILALLTALVIIGGIRSIARVTSKLVPFMALLYVGTALVVIGANFAKIPAACYAIVSNAFSPQGVTGGMVAVLILGFRRAAFSNEAGIGSSAVAHSAVQTKEPLTQGFVAMLEPFIDTVIICSITALVITVTVYDPTLLNDGTISGVELTSNAFASVIHLVPVCIGRSGHVVCLFHDDLVVLLWPGGVYLHVRAPPLGQGHFQYRLLSVCHCWVHDPVGRYSRFLRCHGFRAGIGQCARAVSTGTRGQTRSRSVLGALLARIRKGAGGSLDSWENQDARTALRKMTAVRRRHYRF